MSVILKALRSQQDEGGADPILPESGGSGAFQVDDSGNTQGGGSDPGAKKRQIILLIILAISIVVLVVLHFVRREEVPPPPIPLEPVKIVVPPPAPETPEVSIPDVAGADNDLQIARSQYKSGQYEDSLKSFQKALDKDPNNSAIHNDMGLVLLKKELYTSAESHFARALELDDTCAECYNNLGYLKTTLEQLMEAEKYLQKAVMLKPDYPDPYFNLGVMYEKNGDIRNSVESYRTFLKKIPKTDGELAAKIKSRIHDLSGE